LWTQYHIACVSLQLRDLDPGSMDLFVCGTQDALPGAGRLDVLGLGDGSELFMLHREGWCWDTCGTGFDITLMMATKTTDITLSEDRLVATKGETASGWQPVTGGSPMTEGRHYWEVELTAGNAICIGAMPPSKEAVGIFPEEDDYFINGFHACLQGNGCSASGGPQPGRFSSTQGRFAEGDRIGVLLDLDAATMCFYRNGRWCGQGFAGGVKGPLVRAVKLSSGGNQVTVLPGAATPGGAGELYSSIVPGAWVVVFGLQTAAGQALNGQRGVARTFNEKTGRWAVQMGSGRWCNGDKPVALKPANLQPDGVADAAGDGSSGPPPLPELLAQDPADGYFNCTAATTVRPADSRRCDLGGLAGGFGDY
jgi:hypothetical protein